MMYSGNSLQHICLKHLTYNIYQFCHYGSLDFSQFLFFFTGYILKQCTAFYILQESLLNKIALVLTFIEMQKEGYSAEAHLYSLSFYVQEVL